MVNQRNKIKEFNVESEGFGHIQSECANTLKKKGKSLKTTWSDEDSDGSEEEDDYMNNYIAFQVTSKKNGSTSVMPDVATSKTAKSNIDVATTNNSESDLDSSDGKNQLQKTFKKPIRSCMKIRSCMQNIENLKREDCGADQREKSVEENSNQL